MFPPQSGSKPEQLNTFGPIHTLEVPPLTMDKLTTFLNETPDCFVFECASCGKTRKDSRIADPGLLFEARTCAMARKSCDREEDPWTANTPEYLPGSLVFVDYGNTPWPAIVEYSMDEHCDYGLKNPGEKVPYAYFVTLVGLDSHASYGGWYSTQALRPLKRIPTVRSDPHREQALQSCYATLDLSLRQRLLALSYVANKLRLAGFVIDGTPIVGDNEEVGYSSD
ncbi:uncharacterized protein LOC100898083 [Galendromus occidentalis]|uniref:Uncharacterized protein LOC100898083 n=1 Tax=Galendromus occidentalis TaxID=34638 RepID=A0AAJ6QXQ5_9ACAR|nr:uncharacterized protein LOC100898083 [Galendromus occidentalis]